MSSEPIPECFEALISKGGEAVATSFVFDTMGPDEWQGAIADTRLLLDELESGRGGFGSRLTPARASEVSTMLLQNAAAIAVLVHQLRGRVPGVK